MGEPCRWQYQINAKESLLSYAISIALFSIMLLASRTSFADDLSAIEILHRAAATYRGLNSYECSLTLDTVRGQKVSEQRLTESGQRPGKYRIVDANPKGVTTIGDGKIQWVTSQDSSQYTRSEITAQTLTPISEFESIDQHVTDATLAREELFVVDGKPVPVYVVMVKRNRWPADAPPHPQFVAYRIDEQSFVVHKAITYAGDVTRIAFYSMSKWNQPVEATLFSFAPPQSALAVSSVRAQQETAIAIVGSEAPDFTLQDISGHPIHLWDLRGKVVVLDFWATWCLPCRALMPHLQKMHQDLSSQGLTILGLDVGEDSDEVSEFAKKESYTFRLLLGAEPDVSAKYYVEGYPTTFVVDRNGRITFRAFSEDSAASLRKAVENALR